MIKIDFEEPTTDEWISWRERCDEAQETHNNAIEAGNHATVNASIYKGQKEQVYLNREGPFHGKCVYCETLIYTNQHGDIEHFRPKGAINNLDGTKVTYHDSNGIEKVHPGYYWLAYNWTNLTPSCILCNQPSTSRVTGEPLGKRTYFPLNPSNPFRAIAPGEENDELPLLINPIEDDPSDHLDLDISGVYSFSSVRGDACISIFGLNDRDLPNERAKAYQDVTNLLGGLSQQIRIAPNSPETIAIIQRLEKIKAGYENYTAAAKLAIKHWRTASQAIIDLL